MASNLFKLTLFAMLLAATAVASAADEPAPQKAAEPDDPAALASIVVTDRTPQRPESKLVYENVYIRAFMPTDKPKPRTERNAQGQIPAGVDQESALKLAKSVLDANFHVDFKEIRHLRTYQAFRLSAPQYDGWIVEFVQVVDGASIETINGWAIRFTVFNDDDWHMQVDLRDMKERAGESKRIIARDRVKELALKRVKSTPNRNDSGPRLPAGREHVFHEVSITYQLAPGQGGHRAPKPDMGKAKPQPQRMFPAWRVIVRWDKTEAEFEESLRIMRLVGTGNWPKKYVEREYLFNAWTGELIE